MEAFVYPRVARTLHLCMHTATSDITIEPVRSLSEFCQAMSKLHIEYVRLGLLERQQGDMVFSPWFFQRSSQLLVAKKEGKVIGTISFIPQEELGIPAEKVFSREIQQQDSHPQYTAEIGSLCIDEHYRGTSLLHDLYIAAILYAALWQRIKTIYIQVESRKVQFYQDMQFRSVGDSRPHPTYNNRALSLLRMDIKPMLAQLRVNLVPSQYLTLKQVMHSLHIDGLYQRLHSSLQHSEGFRWNAESARYYCQQCGIDTNQADQHLRNVLQQINARR